YRTIRAARSMADPGYAGEPASGCLHLRLARLPPWTARLPQPSGNRIDRLPAHRLPGHADRPRGAATGPGPRAGPHGCPAAQRFGQPVTADQEVGLDAAQAAEADPALRTALSTVLGALRPRPAFVGRRLQGYTPAQAAPASPTEGRARDDSP